MQHYGVPELVVIDQGGEFGAEFTDMMEEYSMDSRLAGSHAAWQHGLAERHGAILGEIWEHITKEHHSDGRAEAKLAMAVCLQAKNATMSRNGVTPEQAVFGRSLRWTESANKDDDE